MNQLAGLHPQRAVVQLNLGRRALLGRARGRGGRVARGRRTRSRTPGTRSSPATSFIPSTPGSPCLRDGDPDPELPAGPHAGHPARAASQSCRGRGGGRGKASLPLRAAAARAPGVGRARVHGGRAGRAPANAEAQVAGAVGRFDKTRPADAFSALGPLTRRFPRAVRPSAFISASFCSGLARSRGTGTRRRATTVEPASPLAAEARAVPGPS